MADILAQNEGSIVLLIPNSNEGKAWIEENLQLESWQWHGGGAVVEWRYAPDMVHGMIDDGLEVIPASHNVTEDDKEWLGKLGISFDAPKTAAVPQMNL